ncbi:outer membrane receptor protein involved in Fe transport [Novosphingobium sp. 1748]|uniref:TonB-dependent receptor domain-containing protein n=1 Tax=Novosphingobium sp. 1748 TaxID=2817760 RepID=UPI00285CFAA1|nr:TonB-dependent receptor [Novosphingobium sp. 1748]MDR6708303.1 outer membrane receptor protein involved in Fe transport [Novosphingobium sp. 1748]
MQNPAYVPGGTQPANIIAVGNYKPSSGGYDVKEGFAEVAVPIFKDSPIGRSLNFNAAIRATDYSTSGWVTTWKAGLVYDVVDGIKLRGTFSRDIRAPNLNEYFLGGQSTSQQVRDPANNNVNVQVLRIQSSNTGLQPERSDTRTFGIVFQPDYMRGLSLSLDYYRIKIDGSIGTLTNQQLVDRCYAGNTALCGFIIRDSANQIQQLIIKPVNFRQEVMEGVDFEGSYRFCLGNGQVTLRGLWNYTGKHYINGNGLIDDLIGEVGQGNGPTRWRGFHSANFDNEHFGLSLRHRYIGAGVIDAAYTSADIANNNVPAVSYFDASATTYDLVDRFFRVGLRFDM